MNFDDSTIQYFKFVALCLILLGVFLYVVSREVRFQTKKFLRQVLYRNFIVAILRNKFLQVMLPAISATYYLCLDIWKDKWSVIKDHLDQHELIFLVLVGLSLLFLMLRATVEYFDERSENHRLDLKDRFILLTSRLVKGKLDRFKAKARSLTPNGNTFKEITQPKDQIRLILSEVVSLLESKFRLQETELCITIMHEDPKTRRWYFKHETNESLKHTKPEILLKENSTARECLEIGEAILHVDKVRAANQGKYHLSERDKRSGDGSVFCYPAFTSNRDYEDRYIITIVTYGKMLCDPVDSAQANAIKLIFSDICRRIDLELTLESIKYWQFEYHTSATRKRA